MVIELEDDKLCDPLFKVFTRFAHAREESLPAFYRVHTKALAEESEVHEAFWKRMMGRR
jgi:hypothetical protein